MWCSVSRVDWLPLNISCACAKKRTGNLPSLQMTSLRDLPSVEQLLQNANQLIAEFGRPLTLDALRLTLDENRTRFKTKPDEDLPSMEAILSRRLDSTDSATRHQRNGSYSSHEFRTRSIIKSDYCSHERSRTELFHA